MSLLNTYSYSRRENRLVLMKRIVLLAVWLCVPLLASTAQSAGDVTPIASASAVTCEDAGANTSKPLKSGAGFTSTLEVRAVLEGKDKDLRCLTSWILHVSGPGLMPTSVEVQSREDKPSDNDYGDENSFEAIHWSKDGTRLLVAAVMAAGDWDETSPVIYDFQKQKFWRLELVPLFSKVIGKSCDVYFRPVQFISSSAIEVFIAPLERDNPCFASSIWSLDYETKAVRKIRNSK